MVGKEWGEFVFAPPSARSGEVVNITPDEAHHLFRVRRVVVGATVWVTDGEGCVHRCRIRDRDSLLIEESFSEFGEPSRNIALCVSALKGDRNREIVGTAVQLGVRHILFFAAARSEGRVDEDDVAKLRRKAIAAIKQCGRARLPIIETRGSLAGALLCVPRTAEAFVAHPAENPPRLEKFRPEVEQVTLLVGPEGGLLESEFAAAVEAGFEPLSLGTRRLRAETAVAAGLSYLLLRCGD